MLVLPWTFDALGPGVHDVMDMEELVVNVFHPERRAWLSAGATSFEMLRGCCSFMVADGKKTT